MGQYVTAFSVRINRAFFPSLFSLLPSPHYHHFCKNNMVVFPCCKINLGLNVVARRSDGYHDIETLFYPVPLNDNLEVVTASRLTTSYVLHETGIPLEGSGQHNLVVRVLETLRETYPQQIPPVEIWLHKRIPAGAGLGGGSSDAAFMKRLLNTQYDLGMNDEDIEYRLARLGADCAFFNRCKPAFATGIGDRLMPVNLSLAGWNLVLVKPDVYVSTREAFSMIVPQRADHPLLEALQRPVETWRETVSNDFEKSVFLHYPKIAAIKATLYDMGAVYASMSGSGSCVYALFHDRQPEVKDIFPDCFVYETRLRILP